MKWTTPGRCFYCKDVKEHLACFTREGIDYGFCLECLEGLAGDLVAERLPTREEAARLRSAW